MPVDDSEFLEPYSPRHFQPIRLYAVDKADLVLFYIVPSAFLLLCDVWISILMWFNNMDYVGLIFEVSSSGTSIENVNNGGSSEVETPNVTPADSEPLQTRDELPTERVPQPAEVDVPHDHPVANETPSVQDEVSSEPVPHCDHCLSTMVEPPIIRCPANHVVCLECLSEHADVQLSKGDPEHPITSQ